MNYYEILEVSVNASKEVIKNAYRALSKKYHPDTYKGDKSYAEEKLKEINSAYETLIDEEKRLLYDYDNGFKIDPNAPIEVAEENTEQKYSKEEVKQAEDKFSKFLKEKKILVIIIVIFAFILAFVIGLFIANSDSSKATEEKEEKKEQTTNIKKDKDSKNIKNNSNYNFNYNDSKNTINNNEPITNNEEVVINPPDEEKEDNVVKDNTENSEDTGDYGIS